MLKKPASSKKRNSAGANPEYIPLNVTSRNGHQSELSLTASTVRSTEKEADLQGNKIVDITKMLASDQYTIGKQLGDFTKKFLADLEADTTWKDPSKYVARDLILSSQASQLSARRSNQQSPRLATSAAAGATT